MTLTLADERPPIPPADLILRVAPSFGEGDIDANRLAFDVGAIGHLQNFERAMALLGRSFNDFERLLDFGCGCGRFIRHLGQVAEQVEVHGTDIDAEMIEWCAANIPYGRFAVAPHEPPLAYPDGHFDLIINHSVFTHLDEHHQDMWLGELQRVSSPGGLVLLTVEGQASWNRLVETCARESLDTTRWRAELESRGILFIRDDLFVGSTHPDFYHSTFHAPWYVFEHWSQFFEVVAFLPDGSISQDMIVLRRRSDDAPAPTPLRARPAGPAAASAGVASTIAPVMARLQRRLQAMRQQDGDRVDRELSILRAGLYEQGNRLSVVAAELRAEIDALRGGDST
jgi:SAM-dependent methyltransferase